MHGFGNHLAMGEMVPVPVQGSCRARLGFDHQVRYSALQNLPSDSNFYTGITSGLDLRPSQVSERHWWERKLAGLELGVGLWTHNSH